MSRDEAEAMVEENGGKNLSAVSKNLNYLVAGEKAGSKLEKANKLGITVLTEDAFLEMIGAG
jgi:DNA ligase (NAD+)